MRAINTLLVIMSGRAIVLVRRDERKADVLVGKDVSRQFAISSMVGAVKALLQA